MYIPWLLPKERHLTAQLSSVSPSIIGKISW